MTSSGGDDMGCEKLVDAVGLAIKKEEEAFAFYMELAGTVEDKEAKETLRFLAGREKTQGIPGKIPSGRVLFGWIGHEGTPGLQGRPAPGGP